jgi:hypothetical protein
MSGKSSRLNQFNAAFDKIKIDGLRWSHIKENEDLGDIWEERENGSKVMKKEVYDRIVKKWTNFYNT